MYVSILFKAHIVAQVWLSSFVEDFYCYRPWLHELSITGNNNGIRICLKWKELSKGQCFVFALYWNNNRVGRLAELKIKQISIKSKLWARYLKTYMDEVWSLFEMPFFTATRKVSFHYIYLLLVSYFSVKIMDMYFSLILLNSICLYLLCKIETVMHCYLML